jgi:hypothetical protein
MTLGRRRVRRSPLALLAAVSATLIAAGSASAATEIGTTFDPGTSFCGNLLLQSVSPPTDPYAAPSAGVITSWSYQASSVPVQLQLKAGRAAGTNQFTIVAESAVETAASPGLNTFATRISVQAGDPIGIRPVTNGLPCIRGMSPGYSYSAYVMGDDLSPGTTATFNPPNPNVQLDVAANLEPDADTDGFGDETQDRCLGVPGPMDGCPSNAFTFGELKRNKKNGTATLTVSVPNPGDLTGSGSGARVASAKRVMLSKSVGAGAAELLIKAKGKKRRKLNRTGKVRLNVAVTYTPAGGQPNTQSLQVKLKKKL